jgi:phosphoribosylamine--glycine ligase
MARHGIPTAAYKTFTDAHAAHAYVDARGAPIVVKADGLAAGKGVVVAATADEAHAAIDAMLVGNRLGEAGARVVIEDCLVGEEASFIVMGTERTCWRSSSQDHKRLQVGDLARLPVAWGVFASTVVTHDCTRASCAIIHPAVNGMAADGIPYTVLYAGVMIDAEGNPRTLEFNCRLGDPETQPILLRLKSDLLELLQRAVDGTLDQVDAEWDRRAALGVVLAAAGYPDRPREGDVITGLDAPLTDGKVFHAATAKASKGIVTSGGRVLCVSALGETVRLAQRAAYAAVTRIHFDGMQYRTDIGHRAIVSRKG